jgi:hypothetical protein
MKENGMSTSKKEIKRKVLVRFPNESHHTLMDIDWGDFVLISDFPSEIFGNYRGMTISIKK